MKVGSLCTGILGSELALSMMGLEPDLRWYSEIDKHACAVIAAKTDAPNLGDLKLIEWERVEPVDILVAGYPCQPFSHAGNRKGTDDPRHLWPWIACALRVLRPRYALFENVAAHLGLGFDEVLSDLAAIGFDAEWTTLRASDVGACHQRDRLFIVARDSQRPRTDALATPGGPRGAVGESDRGLATDALRPGGRKDTGAARRHEAEHSGGGSVDRDEPLGDGEAIGGARSDGQRTTPDADQGRRSVRANGGGVL